MGLIRKGRGLYYRVSQLEDKMTVNQQELDELTTRVGELQGELEAGITTVQNEVDALEAQIGTGTAANELDLNPLKTALANLGTDVGKVGSVAPTPKGVAGAEQAPTKADGTAAENTADPQEAQQQAQS